jgi:hypothetical protein
MNGKRLLLTLTAVLCIGFLAGWFSRIPARVEDFIEKVDTLVVRDTIMRDRPVFVDRYLVRTDTVKLAVHDTTLRVDSVLVDVPIERRIYEEDSLYRAVVSGYRPSLDSLLVYRTTTEITKFVPVPVKKRWGVGIQAGYGFSRKGISPYVGVGISYNLINF